VQIAAGNSIDETLTAFGENVNQPGTVFSTGHWLLPKLDQLREISVKVRPYQLCPPDFMHP
jgi:hypothetical protein